MDKLALLLPRAEEFYRQVTLWYLWSTVSYFIFWAGLTGMLTYAASISNQKLKKIPEGCKTKAEENEEAFWVCLGIVSSLTAVMTATGTVYCLSMLIKGILAPDLAFLETVKTIIR